MASSSAVYCLLANIRFTPSSYSATFMVFAVSCTLAYFWATYIVPETANVSLEEIDAVFASSAGREDAQLRHEVCVL